MIELPPSPAIAVVTAQVHPDHDAEFNRWYDERHLPQTVGCPGFRGGARFRTSDQGPPSYIAIYAIDDEKTMESEELARVRGFEHLTPYVSYERRIYRPLSSYEPGKGLTRY